MNKESGKIRSFTDLNAWKMGHELVLMTYQVSKNFPRDEIFGLTSQTRRCAVSITSNIAEGFSRQSYKEKIQFYAMALGSVTELQNQILIARDVGYLKAEFFKDVVKQSIMVHKLLNGLIRTSRSHS